MSNSIPLGKKVVVSVVMAIIGFIIVIGFSTSAAIAIAIGLFIGSLAGPKLHTFKIPARPKKPARKAKAAVATTSVGDGEATFFPNDVIRRITLLNAKCSLLKDFGGIIQR